MSQTILSAELRTQKGSGANYRLRKTGLIPAVFYGKGEEGMTLSVSPKELEKAISGDLGTNTLITLKVAGKGDYSVLLKDFQAHPVKRHFTHADFIKVDLTKKMRVSVPVHLIGKCIGVKEGGILEQTTREVEINCLPTSIPKEVLVDITNLKIGQNFHMSDIKLPDGAEFVGKADLTLVSIVQPREEEVAAPAAAGAAAEPEVLKQKAVPEEAAKAAGGKDAKPAEKKK